MKTLRLTTTEAYSLVCDAFEPTTHLPIVNEIGVFINKAGKWSGYIHGKAEDIAGFDIPLFISGELPDREGDIPAILVLPSMEIKCTIVQWKPKSKHSIHDYRALIVINNDIEGLEYAHKCFKERFDSL